MPDAGPAGRAAIALAVCLIAWDVPPPAGEAPGQPAASPQHEAADVSADGVMSLLRRGDYFGAEAAARELLSRTSARAGPESPQAAEALSLLVESLWRGGKSRVPESLELARRAMALRAALFGESDPRLADSLDVFGSILHDAGEFTQARGALTRGLEMRRAALGPDHLDVAASLLHLGSLENSIGDLAAASRMWEEAFAIQQRALGPDHPDVAGTLANLARVAYVTGELVRARGLMERSLAMREKALGPDHPDTARSRANLTGILMDLGDYRCAEKLARESLQARERSLGPDHPQVASSLSQTGRALHLLGADQEAIPLLRRAVQIEEKGLGPDHPKLAANLNNLALLLQAAGDPVAALPLLERAAGIQRKALGADSSELAETLDSLGLLRLQMGELPQAREQLESALSTFTRNYGASHPRTAKAHLNLAEVIWLQGDAAAALEEALLGNRLLREQFDRIARALTEQEALRHEATRLAGLDLAVSILMAASPERLGPRAAEQVWDEILRSRARVLEEMIARRRSAAAQESPALAASLAALSEARKSLATLVVKGPAGRPAASYQEDLAEAAGRRDRAERGVAEVSAVFRRELQADRAGLSEVRAAMPAGGALVAHASYNRIAWRPEGGGSGRLQRDSIPSYVAFALSPDGSVQARDLGAARELDARVRRWRQEVSTPPPPASQQGGPREEALERAGASLRRAAWDPIAPAIHGARTLFWVPDGSLHLISLAALPAGPDRFLIETLPVLHLLSSERSLAGRPEGAASASGTLVLGSPSFDALPGAPLPVARSEAAPPPAVDAALPEACRTPHVSCEEASRLRFQPLPESLEEVREIGRHVHVSQGAKRAARPEGLSLTGDRATEAAFKRMAPGKRLLHIATHGFFMDESCESSLARASSLARKGTRAELDTILAPTGGAAILAGLALAGANRRKEAAREAEDGILTGDEIASMDLSAAEWVVLSACDTGVGPILTGEGVLGLRRAFEVAGARTLVMSLWKVGDESTRQWMRRLYEARSRGESAAGATRSASLSILRQRRLAGRSTHPFHWGAFVAAGTPAVPATEDAGRAAGF